MTAIRLIINVVLLGINTVVCPALLFVMGLLRLIPIAPVQDFAQRSSVLIAELWVNNNSRIFNLTLPTKWNLDLPTPLQNRSYLVIANHQSWVDIVALQYVFGGKIPFFRFFLKSQLIFVPILGLCWWVLDYPFMKRHSKEQIKKNPELKNHDKEVAIRQMQKFKDIPVSIMVFVEGTRFTSAKHAQQQSPYQGLLKPRAAGAAYALNVLSEQLDTLLDVGISYPQGIPTFFDFLCGHVPEIRVHARAMPIAESLRVGDYESDKAYRVTFQNWLNDVWREKEQRLHTPPQQHTQGDAL